MDEPTVAKDRSAGEAALRPGERFAGLEVRGVAGRGGMGIVYRATDPRLGRDVALKIIAPALAADAGFRERFAREARAAAQIEHPAVVPVYAAGEHDGRLFLAMRFIAGVDLAKLLLADGPLAPERALALLRQVADALDAAHARGLVHRDVKPANVLVSGERAYLGDFGLAVHARGDARLTASGHLMGTPAYLAPEQIRGAPADRRADVYALGAVLHHCLTGAPPFPAERALDAIAAHLTEPPPRPSAVNSALPAALDGVLARALAKDPGERFAGAAELINAAEDALQGRLGAPLARSNLPAASPRLLGREDDLERLASALESDDDRVVTLTGPGGVGKTQLAIAAAGRLRERFDDGVFFVALEGVARGAEVPAAIADALGLTDLSLDALADRGLLLVLDNMEHVLSAAADVARLVEQAPRLRVLVTSQAPLRIACERVILLRPLALPDPGEADLGALSAVPSVALLARRSQAVDPEFELTAANAPALAELCRWLEGMPLALELAAARLAILDPAELLARLQRTVDALGPGRRDAPARQRSVRATLEWTCSLLGEPQRRLLGELSVFAGGFTPAVAELMQGEDVLDRLSVLRELWLVRRDAHGRLHLPPPVRAYAGELLAAAGDEHDARRRHAEALLAVAEPLERDWYRGTELFEALEPEADNLRAAMAWTREHLSALHARLVAACAGWMNMTARDALFRTELDAALAAGHGPELQADVLMAQASFAEMVPDPRLADGAVAAWGERDDPVRLALALFLRSKAHYFAGDGPAAVADAERVRAIAVELGDPDLLDLAEFALGGGLMAGGDRAAALAVADALLARERPQERRCAVLSLRGDILVDERPEAALACYAEAVAHLKGSQQPQNLAFQLDGIAMGLAALGRDADAVTVAAIAQRYRRDFFIGTPKTLRETVQAALGPAVARLGAPEVERCRDRAAAMSLRAAADWAEETARAVAEPARR